MSTLRKAAQTVKSEWEKLPEEEKKKKPFSAFLRAKQIKDRKKKQEKYLKD